MGKKEEQSKEVYNKMAKEYDSSQEGKYTRLHKTELLKQVKIKDGDAILDVACGNGVLLNELSKKARVDAAGTDISKNMVAIARDRYPNYVFAEGSSFPLDFPDKSRDVITVSCAFHHFENPQGFANECMRVLKAKGAVYMAEPYFSPMVRWIANHIVFPLSHSGDVKVYSQKELYDYFEKAGFSEIETYIKGTVLFVSAKKLLNENP